MPQAARRRPDAPPPLTPHTAKRPPQRSTPQATGLAASTAESQAVGRARLRAVPAVAPLPALLGPVVSAVSAAAGQADLPAPRHTVPISQVVELLAGARQRGLDPAPLLARAGIPPVLLGSDRARVTPEQYGALINRLARVLRDELWGLCRQPVPLGSFAAGCRQALAQPTLGDALRVALRHAHPLLSDFRPRLLRQGEAVTLRVAGEGPATPGQNFAQRAFMLFGFGFACWLIGRRIPLEEVTYDLDHLVRRQDAARLFNAPMRLESGVTSFRFAAHWLALPVVRSADELQALLRVTPTALLLKYRDTSSLTERIRRRLRLHLHADMPSLEAVAEAEGLSPKTLRRHLAREGQGFQALKDSLRRDVAVAYLIHHPELSLLAVAHRLGYSEASAFHRAFKAWTGLAPGAYRAQHGGSPRGA